MARGTLSNPFKQKGQTLGGQLLDYVSGGGLVGKALEGVRSRRAAREDEMARAQAELDARMQDYEQMEFQAINPFSGMQVDLQAAQFQREQQAQEQADILQSLRGGSGVGAAALATSLMRSSTEKQREIAADISKQEQNIKMQAAQTQLNLEQQERAFDMDKMTTLLGIDMAEVTGLQEEELARKNRNAQIAGAAINLVGNVASAGIGA